VTFVSGFRHRARGLWITLSSSLWFIPGAIVGVSVVLAVVLIEVSERVDSEALAELPRLFGAGAAGSRGMLSTIAGSVITVAGVTFSITIAALALASAQYTPRVLRTFMGDRANQVVLGTFVGVYSYCLVVLRTIRGGDEGTFVPSIAVLGGFVLALVSVGVLIFFIHHIAGALQASTILDRVRRTTEIALGDLFPDDDSESLDEDESVPTATGNGAAWRALPAPRTGYVQSVDVGGLIAFAREHDVIVRMDRAVGDFVTADAPLLSLAPAEEEGADREPSTRHDVDTADTLRSLFTINAHRTVEQDPAFGILQIADIALKALSPGINDTTTAVTCVDHLGALLACAAKRRIGPRVREEPDGVTVITAGPSFSGLVALAFDDIRRNASGNVTVLGRLFDAIESAATFTRNPGRHRALAEQVELLAEATQRTVGAPSDRELLAERARLARVRLATLIAAPEHVRR
jgi:uncharacterized membrane protein